LIGVVSLGKKGSGGEEEAEGEPDWELLEPELETEEDLGRAEAVAREGSLELAFMPAFTQGAVLAVRRGDYVATVPMYFSS
jgi:hypothetical protein